MSILYSPVPLFSSPLIFFPMQWLEFFAWIEGWHPLCNDSHSHYRISPVIQPSISFALLFVSLWICILRYSLISACLKDSSDFRTSFPFASQFTVILYQVEFELLDLFFSFCFPNHFSLLKFSPILQGKRNTWNYHIVSGSFKLVRTSCSLRSTNKDAPYVYISKYSSGDLWSSQLQVHLQNEQVQLLPSGRETEARHWSTLG